MKTVIKTAGLFLIAIAVLRPIGSVAQLPPLPPIPTNPYLDSWSFYDSTNWLSDLGYAPVGFTNIIDDESCWSSDDGVLNCNGLLLDSADPALLNYKVVENDGHANLVCSAGTIWFWFSPDWSSTNQGGTGPGNWGDFIDAGAWTSNAAVGWWGLYVDPAGDNIYFSGQTNGAGTNYLSSRISWSAGSWHLIGLTYTATNSILYVDGIVAKKGIGVSYWPGQSILTNGFWIGSDYSGTQQARGEFVDVETWADQYPADYFYQYYNNILPELPVIATGGGSHGDYVPGPPSGGGGTDYSGNLLDSWSFDDTTNWTSDYDYAPVSFTNITSALFGDGTSMVLDTNVPAWLQYNVFENDGTTNLTVKQGSVMFWFAPTWSSTNDADGGTGPQEYGRLLEAGSYTTNSSYGWWSIYVDPAGANIYFSAQTNNGSGNTYTLSAPIDWVTNDWHFVALTYSSTNVSLYLDGELATNDPGGLNIWPGTNVLSHGFYIGSDSTGTIQAQGAFDDLYTYNVPVDGDTIYGTYLSYLSDYFPSASDVPPAIVSAPFTPSTTPTNYEAITGIGNLQLVSTAISGYYGTNVWLANVTASISNNDSITFTIEGGSNGVPYDVFANSVLNFSTNTAYAWDWQGQGYTWNTYTITNVGSLNCFIILGTPYQSDTNGLTEAYQLLVSKTNPYFDDQDGSGLSDSWQVLLGLNPLTNQVAQPGTRSNFSYNPVDWWAGVSGIRTGTNSTDAEGNVLTVSE